MWKYGFLGFSCYFCIMLSKSQNKMNTDFTKDSIESAYCFFHQKLRVYEFSTSPTQRDDIEYAISQYIDGMNPALYQLLANGTPHYLGSPDISRGKFFDSTEKFIPLCHE